MSVAGSDERLVQLVQWSKQHGGSLHENVEIYRDPQTGFSLRVKQRQRADTAAEEGRSQEKETADEIDGGLAPGSVAVTCPLETSLSYLNVLAGGQPVQAGPSVQATDATQPAKGTHVFPEPFLAEVPPHVIGRFFLIREYLRGRESHWYPYIATLPDPSHIQSWALPPVWPRHRSLHQLLIGTNAEPVKGMRAVLNKEYKRAIQLLREAGFPDYVSYSKILYYWAYCMFMSRSFTPSSALPIDLVLDMKRNSGIKHIDNELFEEPYSVDNVNDFSVLLPVLDLGNHHPKAAAKWKLSESEGRAATSLHVQRQHGPGVQLFYNYGQKTNTQLLVGYGFIFPPSPDLHNDYIYLQKRKAAAADTTDATTTASKNDPKIFLLSLRPMSDPSSVVGQDVCPEVPDIDPRFSRVASDLLNNLIDNLITTEQEATLEREGLDRSHANFTSDRLTLLLGIDTPLPKLKEMVCDTLLNKLYTDYEAMAHVDASYDIEDDPEDKFQALAKAYRGQYKDVLRNLIMELDPEYGAETMDNILEPSSDESEDESEDVSSVVGPLPASRDGVQ